MFWLGHGTFVMSLFGDDMDSIENTMELISQFGLQFVLVALVATHGLSFFQNYIGQGEYKIFKLSDLMFSPYRRVVVLHIFIIFGGMVLQEFGVTQLGLIILAIIKIIADLFAHQMEHKKAAD